MAEMPCRPHCYPAAPPTTGELNWPNNLACFAR
jgi:hypothetical protein